MTRGSAFALARVVALGLVASGGCGPRRAITRPQAPEPQTGPLDGIQLAKPEVITPADDLSPSLSPDGRYLAFASELNGNLDIWIKDYAIDSSYPITVGTADDFDPAISPKGDKVVFASRIEDAKGDLFLAALTELDEKRKPERLTDQTTADRQPVFSPDASRIYFTSAVGNGPEFISSLELKTRERKRVSPTPGFDPAPSPDGRYLVYSALGGTPEVFPRLIALRVSDSSTRAITRGDTPEGFARFVPNGVLDARVPHSIVYVRFPDDDNRDGVIDANDHASLWRLDLDLDRIFAGQSAILEPPLPLTDGNGDELFPEPTRFGLYFVQGERQQDILRLSIDGMFPNYDDPSKYMTLADATDDPRTKWFVYRRLLARTPPSSMLHGRALLRIGNLHLSRDRPDLARRAYRELVEAMVAVKAESPEAELASVARVELTSLDRKEGLEKAATPLDREGVLRAAQSDLEQMADEYAWAPRTAARIDLELAEVILDRGDRARAIDAFEEVARVHRAESYSAAKAMLREIDILGISHDADALGEAYARVLRLFPEEREAVRTAAERIVAVQLEGLQASDGVKGEIDALRRLIARHPPPVRTAGRWRLVGVLRSRGLASDAALELERIVQESASDRLNAAKALQELARVEEERGGFDTSLSSLIRLRGAFGDLPGMEAQARDAINRVGLAKAKVEELRGDDAAARAVYKSIIDNDLTQVKAHRRYLSLSAELGRIEEAIQEAKLRAERSPRTPMARYAYGLALTWRDPPDLGAAMVEIEESRRLNPKFVHVYITRGWILEMDQKGDQLANAIDAYQTAKSLNQTSQDPETDLEISMNEGNARYRLGTKTNDVGNVKAAFDRYVGLLNGRYQFLDQLAELVYWERFGRAAAWTEEWAVSATATRQAIVLAKTLGHTSRLPQLYGNLALAYQEAGENAYARQALNELSREADVRPLARRLAIEQRNRAVSKLAATRERTPEMLDSALSDLEHARRSLPWRGINRADYRGRRVRNEDPRFEDAPLWVPTTEDASSAQFGFTDLAELDVNLALAEQAHRRHGERTRAEAIRERRRFLWPDVIATLPTNFAFLPKAPTTLLMLRERLGLTLAAAHDRFEERAYERSEALFEDAESELDRWLGDARFRAARPWLLVDRARVLALRAEHAARSMMATGSGLFGDPSALTRQIPAQLAVLDDPRRAADDTGTSSTADALKRPPDPVLASLPKALTSTLALATTASIALGVPRLSGLDLEAKYVRARLHYARGLLAQVSTPALPKAAGSSAEGASLRSLLARLDATLGRAQEARDAFEAAAREAAGAGPWQGARLVALALDAAAEASTLAGDRSRPLVQATHAQALAIARAIGDQGLATGFELAGLLFGPSEDVARAAELVAQRLPFDLRGILPLAQEALSRSASIALGKNDLPGAISAIDRQMLLATAVSPNVSLSNALEPADRAFGAVLRQRIDALEEAQRELSRSDPSTSKQEHEQRKGRVLERRAAIEALPRDGLSDPGKTRIFAEPVLLDSLVDDLLPDEALLMPAPIAGLMHLFWIDGSTTASDRIGHRETALEASAFIEDVRAIRDQLARDRSASGPAVDRLEQALFSPLPTALAKKRKVLIADALAGGPIPARALRPPSGVAFTHLSSVSVLEALRAAIVVGAGESVVIARPGDPVLARQSVRLAPENALALRRPGRAEPVRGPGASVLDRPSGAPASPPSAGNVAVERMAQRAHEILVIEAPVRLEPDALERSAIDLGGAGFERQVGTKSTLDPSIERDRRYGAALAIEADRFRVELPLDDLRLSARSLVLARVEPETTGKVLVPVDSTALVRLDLVLALRGFASTVLIPREVGEDSVRRILGAYTASVATGSPAGALEQAIEAEAKISPAAELISLIGSPGLDAAGAKRYAKAAVKPAEKRALRLMKDGEYATAVPALERWIRLQLESGELKLVVLAYGALVGILSEKLGPPDPVRAADAQLELVHYLERSANEPKKIAAARLDLGTLLSATGDYSAAEQTLRGAIQGLERAGDVLGAGRGYYQLGIHQDNRHDFKEEAAAIERAIELFESAKAFDIKLTPQMLAAPDAKTTAVIAARRAVRRAGEIYLNRLSDPAKAKVAYERALRYAQDDGERNRVQIDLARVARRRGDFAGAAELAERARASAVKGKRSDLETDALIEAANVAWYQGDYRRGQELCEQSLSAAQALKGDTPSLSRQKRKRKIFALSVCGLLAMSRRDFDRAKTNLERARRIAEGIGDQSEIASQYNNLGRVYLEFGRLGPALDAFQHAQAIDESLADRFALAYDFRNIGTALAYKGDSVKAKAALERALQFAIEVQDANNELRARFALAELARDAGQIDAALALYKDALPLAKNLDVKELDWQIHRALGLIAKKRGDLDQARKELENAVQIARSLTGRAQAADFGPHRYAAFDDLIGLMLEQEKVEEAFSVADLARGLEQTELLDDNRIPFSSPIVPRLLREARTGTVGAEALRALAQKEPRLAEVLTPVAPAELARRLRDDRAIIMYRVADEELVAFVIDHQGLRARRTGIKARVLRDQIRAYGRGLAARADVFAAGTALSAVLIEPIRDLIAEKKRLAIIPHRLLHYVAFAALPFGKEAKEGKAPEAILDHFTIVESLDPAAAAGALEKPLGSMSELAIVALGAPALASGQGDRPLPFAEKEIELIREEYPQAELVSGARVTKASLAAAFGRATGVVHFAGHSRMTPIDSSASLVDPLGSELRAADGGLTFLDVLKSTTRARLIVLSACSTMLSFTARIEDSQAFGDELLSLAESFHLAGADNVLATTMHVSDVAAAMVMKRFYRASRTLDAPSALREAQRVVRQLYPHPAWWATYVLLSRS